MNKMETKAQSLKERMTMLRAQFDISLPVRRYLMVMIDGHSFSKMVKNKYELPFDDRFINMMNETAIYVAKNVGGCKFAYVQSDEITFVITDFDGENTQPYFGNRLCKILSIIPSMASAKFNQLAAVNLLDTPCSPSDMKDIIADMKLCDFDAKAWVVNNYNDMFAHILWRQIDCVRNSKQQAAQTYLPHKRLMNLTTDEAIALLKTEKDIDWNNYRDDRKFGRFIYREQREMDVENRKTGEMVKVTRNMWEAHDGFPLMDDGGRDRFIGLGIIPDIDAPEKQAPIDPSELGIGPDSTITEIQIAINKRIEAYEKMVGQLYPSICFKEIVNLLTLGRKRLKTCSDEEFKCYVTFRDRLWYGKIPHLNPVKGGYEVTSSFTQYITNASIR